MPDETGPLRVFCGWDTRQAQAAEVFCYSLEANSSVPVEVYSLRVAFDRGFWSAKAVNQNGFGPPPLNGFRRVGTTGFTYTRFLVPFFCGYKGRAVFVDGCDMLCLGDVRELAELELRHPIYVAKHPPIRMVPLDRPRSWSSMMLLDCGRLLGRWTPEAVEHQDADDLMRLRTFRDDEIGELPAGWNVLAVGDHRSADGSPRGIGRPLDSDVKLAHWSHLSDPDGDSWITRSKSALWNSWRKAWLQSVQP